MDTWSEADSYELYMGRWSAPIGRSFLAWVGVSDGARWLDVGCGTGALSAAIAETRAPAGVAGVDASPEFAAAARRRLADGADVRVGDAQALPFGSAAFDATVSGLCLNFVPDPGVAVREMGRVTRDGGTVAAYVWDYAEGMEMIRRFWDVATRRDPAISHLDEATRFPLCNPQALESVFAGAGLADIETTALDVPTIFAGFDDFWRPFLGGQGPAPTYVASLSLADRNRLAADLEAALPTAHGGEIHLSARAWAVKGVRPPER